MSKKTYLNLLIFCGCLSPGIFGSFLEDNDQHTTNLHWRHHRMLEHHADAVFITRIILGQRVICTGPIVSPKYVLATDACRIVNPKRRYFVVSGVRNLCAVKSHRIKNIHRRGRAGLVLFELLEPINLKNPSMNRPMPFYETNVSPELPHLNIYSWDSNGLVQLQTHVSIVDRAENPSLRDDQLVTNQMHGNIRVINDFQDFGAPLAVGHHLVGILVTPGSTRDIFTLVHVGTEHYAWIMQHIHADLQTLVNRQQQHNHK